MAKKLEGQALKKLNGLVAALRAGNEELAAQRAKVLFGLLQSEDVAFGLVPQELRGKLRACLSKHTAALAEN